MTKSVGQIQAVLKYFEEEYNPIILEKMMKDNYTRDAVHTLKLKVAKIDRITKRCFFLPFFNKIAKRADRERRKSFITDSQFAYKCFLQVREGEMLQKIHYSSNGSRKEFFKIIENQYLRWSRDKKNITDVSKCHNIPVSTIRGLTFGKVTSTFQKKKNAKLLDWLCMSIILDKRPFDIYCSIDDDEERINRWYVGLAYAIKKHNPNAFVLSPGKFFWRKMVILLRSFIHSNMSEEMKKKYSKKSLSLWRVVRQFGKYMKTASK